jgi:hypothetical protein
MVLHTLSLSHLQLHTGGGITEGTEAKARQKLLLAYQPIRINIHVIKDTVQRLGCRMHKV